MTATITRTLNIGPFTLSFTRKGRSASTEAYGTESIRQSDAYTVAYGSDDMARAYEIYCALVSRHTPSEPPMPYATYVAARLRNAVL